MIKENAPAQIRALNIPKFIPSMAIQLASELKKQEPQLRDIMRIELKEIIEDEDFNIYMDPRINFYEKYGQKDLDGVALIWDTKDKNAISFLIFGQVTMRKAKNSMEPTLKLADYAGTYLPEKKDTILKPMEILNSTNKLFRFIENPDDYTANRNIELEFVTGNIFFYPDKSERMY